jgi:hypothetical protein
MCRNVSKVHASPAATSGVRTCHHWLRQMLLLRRLPRARKQLQPRGGNSHSGRSKKTSRGPQLQIAPGYKSSGLNRSLFCDIRVGEVCCGIAGHQSDSRSHFFAASSVSKRRPGKPRFANTVAMNSVMLRDSSLSSTQASRYLLSILRSRNILAVS